MFLNCRKMWYFHLLKVQPLQGTVTPARCIFLDGLTFNLKHVCPSHGAAAAWFCLLNTLVIWNLEWKIWILRLSNGGKLLLMRHRHHLVHVTYLAPHSTLLSVPLCVGPILGFPLLLRTSALISPTAAAVVCGRGQKMVLSRMLSTLESILDVVRQEAARPFFCIIFAMFSRTPQQSTKRVNNI